MKRLPIVILVCACTLVPTPGRADDGGWLDWLWKWDPKLGGVSAEIHVLCLDKDGKKVFGCEEWFKNLLKPLFRQDITHSFKMRNPSTNALEGVNFDAIKHEIDFRFGYLWNYGNRYASPDPPIQGSIHALKLMGMYHYHINEWVAVGAGAGYLPVWGDRFRLLSRGIVTPVSVIIYPIPGWKAFALRPELTWIPKGFTAADFGDDPKQVSYSKKNEWNVSVAVGFDLRRIGSFD